MLLIFGTLAATYLVLLLILYSLQDWLIFPGKATQGTPDAEFTPPPRCERVSLKARGSEDVAALFGPALDALGRPLPDARSRPTLLFFYGNGECISRDLRRFAEFRRLGCNVMIPDYLGYGLSGGKASEAGCYAAADAAFDHLLTRADVDASQILVGGWSLGGAVAIDLASRRPVRGLFAFCTFTSMADMVGERYPFAPRFLLAHKFASREKIAKVSAPILLGHGREDDAVPSFMAERLAAAAKARVTRIEIAGANHNDFFEVGHEAIDAALRKLAAVANAP